MSAAHGQYILFSPRTLTAYTLGLVAYELLCKFCVVLFWTILPIFERHVFSYVIVFVFDRNLVNLATVHYFLTQTPFCPDPHTNQPTMTS